MSRKIISYYIIIFYYFLIFNANKKSITADLKSEKGLAIVKKLAAEADVMIENFAPGVIERLGLGYDEVKKVNPSIIYAQVKGFAEDGPYSDFLSFDMIGQAAGGIMSILGQLDRAGLLDTSVPTVHAETMAHALDRWDVTRTNSESVHDFYRAAPGGVRTTQAFSQQRRYETLDLDREQGVIRSAEHAFSKDGGLAVLYGNLA